MDKKAQEAGIPMWLVYMIITLVVLSIVLFFVIKAGVFAGKTKLLP